MALTKSEILQGVRARKTIHVPALNGDVVIRPLTDGEFHEIQLLFMSAVQMTLNITDEDLKQDIGSSTAKLAEKVSTNIDVNHFASADYKSSLLAAAFGLSVSEEEKWSPEEVEGLPPGAAQQIAEEVYELSGARPEQEVMLRHFRGDTGRSGAGSPASNGRPASANAVGADSGSADRAGGSVEATTPDEGESG